MTFLKLYLVSLGVFFMLDLFWLGSMKNFYKEQIGFLMSGQIKWTPALLFYLLYVAGLVFFAIWPAFKVENWVPALLYGGFFGLVCYATYDLTNLATLKGWPIKMVVYDLLWGTFASGATSLVTFWVANHWRSYFH